VSGIGDLLNPRSVAVIGASEDQTKFGGRLYKTLLRHRYAGAVYPINPNRPELFGIKTYADLTATPTVPDMVVMAVPRARVKENIRAAAAIGVRGGIIITSKFSDEGPEGAALEAEIVAIARAGNMRLIGPNCLGMISPANRVVLCSSPALEPEALPVSPIGFVSQSGALMATVFDRARDRGIGFTHCISVGNQADLELCDFVEYFLDDERTHAVTAYVEGIKDPPRFLTLAKRAQTLGKPWLMVKAGRTESGAKAAFSHTASLAGSFQALETICRENGIILMDDLDSMMLLAANLVRWPNRAVRTATIVTTSGGGGAIASDRLAENGVPLTSLDAQTANDLAEYYSEGQAGNPIDLGGRLAGDESIDVASATMTALAGDPAQDVALVLMTTSPDIASTSGKIADAALAGGKPFQFVMAPGTAADRARQALVERGLPFADTLDEAVRAIAAWAAPLENWPTPERPANLPLQTPHLTGQLDSTQTADLLKSYGLPLVRQFVCPDQESARSAAKELGYPVVLKALATAIVHKSEAGAVALGLATQSALDEAMADMTRRLGPLDGFLVQAMMSGASAELIVGVNHDPQFGPMLVIGAGGILVELLHDVALASVPIGHAQATQMLHRLRVHPLLAGTRGRPPLDTSAVADAMVRIGWLAYDLRDQLLELDINPLLVRADGQGCTIVDARVLCR
jgi:acyl-CoA synthetase (NDP forming)